MEQQSSDLRLYSYFRSSCSARLRIALNLKEIHYQTVTVNLIEKEQNGVDYTTLNPSHSVPTLVDGPSVLTQSVAVLEYLEEAYPQSRRLLPPLDRCKERAQVRVLVNIIACDLQPITNLRMLEEVRALGCDARGWIHKVAPRALAAYEATATTTAGAYSVGDEITLADVCLVPAVWAAERFEVDLAPYPVIRRVYDRMSEQPAVQNAHWKKQPDTPKDLA